MSDDLKRVFDRLDDAVDGKNRIAGSDVLLLRTRLATLERELAEARKEVGKWRTDYDAARADLHAARQACNDEHPEVGQVYAALAAARAEVARLRGLVDEVRACGTEDDDPRLRYMIVQIDKGLWGDLKAALDTPAREGA